MSEIGKQPIKLKIDKLLACIFLDKLTPGEMKVLECLADGLDYQETADRLGLSRQTARNVLHVVYAKLRETIKVDGCLSVIAATNYIAVKGIPTTGESDAKNTEQKNR